MQTNENTSPEFIILSEGQVIEKSLPSPPCRTCDRKNPRNSEFIYVAELIHPKPPLSSTFHWAEALQRFCRRFKGVVAAVSVFVKFNQTANTGTAMLSNFVCLDSNWLFVLKTSNMDHIFNSKDATMSKSFPYEYLIWIIYIIQSCKNVNDNCYSIWRRGGRAFPSHLPKRNIQDILPAPKVGVQNIF